MTRRAVSGSSGPCQRGGAPRRPTGKGRDAGPPVASTRDAVSFSFFLFFSRIRCGSLDRFVRKYDRESDYKCNETAKLNLIPDDSAKYQIDIKTLG